MGYLFEHTSQMNPCSALKIIKGKITVSRFAQHVNKKVTPQIEQAKSNQVQNNAEGFVFTIDPWARLDRFLVLGCEGGTYYVTERALTRDNAKTIENLISLDGPRVVSRTVEISDQGRAPKNDGAIFVLAMCAKLGGEKTRQLANQALPKVCRIGTHLLSYANDVKVLGGWGSGTRRAVNRWFQNKSPLALAKQVTKYQSRNGWAMRDLLRLTHPKAGFGPNAEYSAIFHYVSKGTLPEGATGEGIEYLKAVEAIKVCSDAKTAASLIRAHKLPREVLPTQLLNEVVVWEALLEDMGPEALIRNLGKMSSLGMLSPFSSHSKHVCQVLSERETLRKARLHPIKVLAALLTYQQGHGVRGSLTWTTNQNVVDALDSTFYSTFQDVEPTGKNTLLALDISGSMNCGECQGIPGLTPRIGSAAMALITAATEKWHHFVGFSTSLIDLDISPKMRLDQVTKIMSRLPFGGTDCSLPMVWAKKNKIEVDTFVVYTDNETYAGNIHPFQALEQYRSAMGRAAKLVVVGMTATDFTIANPDDAGMLDVVGFDTATPSLIAEFSKT